VAVAQGQALGATSTELAGDLRDQGQSPLLGDGLEPPVKGWWGGRGRRMLSRWRRTGGGGGRGSLERGEVRKKSIRNL
jgi:hypothetical protein